MSHILIRLEIFSYRISELIKIAFTSLEYNNKNQTSLIMWRGMNQAESDDSGRSLFDNETSNATILDQSDDKENIHETENPPEEATTTPAADKRVTLNMVLREALFFLALALTTYDALQNSWVFPRFPYLTADILNIYY